MNKELCFNIENHNLYLEQVLVDYNDIPIFFLCKSEDQYYIALCADIDEFYYIVTKLELLDVYNLLHGQIAMREVILKQKEYWEVISGEKISQDVVKKCSIDVLDKALLPEENACFKILTKKTKTYVEEFDRAFFANQNFTESTLPINFVEIDDDNLSDKLSGNMVKYIELADVTIDHFDFLETFTYSLGEESFEKSKMVTMHYDYLKSIGDLSEKLFFTKNDTIIAA